MGEKLTLYCSFCGKSQYEIVILVAGPAVFICDECVLVCESIVAEQRVKLIVREILSETATPHASGQAPGEN